MPPNSWGTDGENVAIEEQRRREVEELGRRAQEPQMTFRGVVAGLLIGLVVLQTSIYFGLQTGWISTMSLPSSLMAFAVFKALRPCLRVPFTQTENVFVQSLAAAMATGPLAFGLVGIVPALEKFVTTDEGGPIHFSAFQLVLWSLGLAFFGVFFAVPLRKQVIIKEKLRFPSGSATATMISVLHRKPPVPCGEVVAPPTDPKSWRKNLTYLIYTFSASSVYTFTAYFLPVLRNIPFLGRRLATDWLWTFNPSLAYVGQGAIMGLPTVSWMLFGAILGWGILSPIAKHRGWAPGAVDDWKEGSQGFILWISLAIMLADSIVSLVVVVVQSLSKTWLHARGYTKIQNQETDSEPEIDAPSGHLMHSKVVIIGIVLSSIFCVVAIKFIFGGKVPVYALAISVILALCLSILGVRALGETDLNPVSGIGKISQLLFGVIVPPSHPFAVVVNLIAGGVAEAGAQQAGDLMQDLKTGHLIGASPKAQFYAQMIGSAVSAVVSALLYRVYDRVYTIPSDLFRIPTAVIWIDCSRLVTGEGLPPHAREFCIAFGVLFACLSAIKTIYHGRHWVDYMPSGIAVGVGLYNTPAFTLARFVGGVAAWAWLRSKRDEVSLIIIASGLILGEGVSSIGTLIMTSLGVPHW